MVLIGACGCLGVLISSGDEKREEWVDEEVVTHLQQNGVRSQ